MNTKSLWLLLAMTVTCSVSAPAVAHTGSGIAVDHQGNVFFLDTGSGLWKIDTHGKLTKLSGTMFHWLALDNGNRFGQSRLLSGANGDIAKVASDPTVLLSSDWPVAVNGDGKLFYQSGNAGSLQVMQMLPSGATSVLATLPGTTKRAPLPHINGMAMGPSGSLYYTENSSIRRITAQGRVSTVATVTARARGPSIPGTSQHPYLRGLAVDDKGVMIVADNGDARVLKITPAGTITTLLQLQSPWSPTAVALHGADVYVLEFLHTPNDVRREWLPRFRKITADGKSTIIASLDKMPGARAKRSGSPLRP
jgi:DNA-binding beta-propeller fold protein YncE